MRAIALSVALCVGAGCSPGAESPTGGAHVRTPGAPVRPLALVPVSATGVRAIAARPGARATLVNAWATWCVPCRKEMPQMLAVAARHPDVRLVLVSTDFRDQREDARRFLEAHGVEDTTYLKAEDDAAFIDGLDKRWTGALPATFVYDNKGHLMAFWEGAADSARFESALHIALTASR